MRYQNHVTIVTGGSRGIGAECVRVFADAGARVGFCSIDELEGHNLESEINARGRGQVFFLRCDVTKKQELENFIAQTVARYGQLDCLINNAGWHPPHKPIDQFSLDEFRTLLELNVISLFAACQFALPHLRRTSGNIINMASLVGTIGQPNAVTYAATKGAVIAFSKALAIDEAAFGVRVNSVSPGGIDTPLVQEFFDAANNPQQARAESSAAQLLGRLGTAQEVAKLCLFIAAEATFTTGVDHLLTGGAELGYSRKPQSTGVVKVCPRFAYVGCYTRAAPGGSSEQAQKIPPTGVTVWRISPDGKWTCVQTLPMDNPSVLVIHPNQRTLYVMNEIWDYQGERDGSIRAYLIDDKTGLLTLLQRVSTQGALPSHLATDPQGKYLVWSNYLGGNFVARAICADGSVGEIVGMMRNSGVGPHRARQDAPHPHGVMFDPSGQFIATVDLGTDEIKICALGANGFQIVSEQKVGAGSGPRHATFHPKGKVLYVVNELKATVSVFPFDPATGRLGAEIQTIRTVPDDFPPQKNAAEIMVHPSGKFLYASNRKFAEHPFADSIVAFQIEEATGKLSVIGYTAESIAFPRTFGFNLSGELLFVLNQKGDTIVQFAIHPDTGGLKLIGVVAETRVPAGVVFKR
jgi:6-phosphogluconolactonase (cycloisomerase 2 family)/NAD(P)-dependent dehydrogenase (short-subunit alcohol dehydrogenase family)